MEYVRIDLHKKESILSQRGSGEPGEPHRVPLVASEPRARTVAHDPAAPRARMLGSQSASSFASAWSFSPPAGRTLGFRLTRAGRRTRDPSGD